MKALLIIFPIVFLVKTCAFRQTDNIIAPAVEKEKQAPVKIEFEKDIKPIFIKNCSPCHFTGGKMYERLPFDKDTTILNHSDKILKRIKNDDENKLLRDFVRSEKKVVNP